MRNIVIMVLVVTVGLLLLYRCTQTSPHNIATETADSTSSVASTTPAQTNDIAPAAARNVILMAVPIQIDSAGNLVVDTHIKQLFDVLAQQNAETPVDSWKHAALQSFADQLSPAALDQLQQLFDRYVEFNLALQLLPMEGEPNLATVLERIQQLRQHYLGNEVAEPMYADWSALEQFTRQYLDTMTHSRDPAAAQIQMQDLAAQLPAPVRQRALNMLTGNDEEMSVEAIADIDPDAYRHLLQEQAAIALIETQLVFDEPSPAFMNSYEQYGEQKRSILLSEASDAEQQIQLQALREHYFSGADVLRAETLDRAEAF